MRNLLTEIAPPKDIYMLFAVKKHQYVVAFQTEHQDF